MQALQFKLADEAASVYFAQTVAQVCAQQNVADNGFMMYLQGDLGVGKSFLRVHLFKISYPDKK
ncbi:hypothetical protein [Thiomicrorhabdus aquaedulcis]|uniref:hypothetical protein n=1 Tax=Thiomicrorhabdus aquaedulcis TaxID=2211106 RepID=UPI001E594174|nr:hypothetical protein [Thiomicrorhabdus aquaedulcis]